MLNSKTPQKSKWKKKCGWLVHFDKISFQQLKKVLLSLYGPTCLYACLTMTNCVLGDLPSDLDQGITKFLDYLRLNLVASGRLKHTVLEVLY